MVLPFKDYFTHPPFKPVEVTFQRTPLPLGRTEPVLPSRCATSAYPCSSVIAFANSRFAFLCRSASRTGVGAKSPERVMVVPRYRSSRVSPANGRGGRSTTTHWSRDLLVIARDVAALVEANARSDRCFLGCGGDDLNFVA